jgi:uncharacterized membrane protein (DUF441 family)
MFYQIIYYPIFSISILNWLGIIALILFIITASIGGRGLPIDKHKNMAKIAFILALLHGLIAISRYF